jgi:RimJ/RimL family protein N-acetyltransferase
MFDTQRLVLMPFVLTDTADLFRIRGDPHAMAHWDWPCDSHIEQTYTIGRTYLSEMSKGAASYWTARTKTDGEFVGLFDLSELTTTDAELGFMVCRDRWGQGFAYEASTAIVAEAKSLSLTTLKARIHSDNHRSANLLLRLGFIEAVPSAASIEVRPSVFAVCRFFALAI